MPTHETTESRPSELSGDRLYEDRMKAWRKDRNFRSKHTNFDEVAKLYDEGSEPLQEEKSRSGQDIPRVNMVRRMVDDLVAFLLPNFPEAEMTGNPPPVEVPNPMERELRALAVEESVRNFNGIIRSILHREQFADYKEAVLEDTVVFGVGYIQTSVDQSVDLRFSYRLRELLEQGPEQWDESDWRQYVDMTTRITVNYLDPRNVFLQNGIKRFDDKMRRVSIVEKFDTGSLREQYDNPSIGSGRGEFYMEEDDTDSNTITGVLTTWELEPVHESIDVPAGRTHFKNWRMVKTVIGGGEVLENQTWDATEGPVNLPVVPFYIKKAKDHAYGYSQVDALKTSEQFINETRALMFKAGLNSIRPNAFAVMLPNLGQDDKRQLENAAEEGGPAYLDTNNIPNHIQDIREVVMPLNYASAQLDPALRQAQMMEMSAFNMQTNTINTEAMERARTGSGKRAQASVDDRPKTRAIMVLSNSIEDVWDNLYELIRYYFADQGVVTVQEVEGGRREIRINDTYERELPVFDESGEPVKRQELESPNNPDGQVTTEVKFRINDTSLDLKAQAANRASLPMDMLSRYQVLRALRADGLITDRFFRRFTLNDQMRRIDNAYRREERQQQNNRIRQRLIEQLPIEGQQTQGLDPSAELQQRVRDAAQGQTMGDVGAVPSRGQSQN